MKIWLDDQRKCPWGYYWARTYKEAVQLVRQGYGLEEWKVASLDHDLGDGPNGCDFISWMWANDTWPNLLRFHTANPVGRANMIRVMEDSNLYIPHVREFGTWVLAELEDKMPSVLD